MMKNNRNSLLRRGARSGGLLTTIWLVSSFGGAAAMPADSEASALRATHATLQSRLLENRYQRPLVIDSSESADAVSGIAYAVINYPHETVVAALQNPASWCAVLMLHLNTKYCSNDKTSGRTVLKLGVGKKTRQEMKDAYAMAFDFKVSSATPDFMSVRLVANSGPLGTHNYRIELKTVAIADGKTFMQLRYSYGYGMAGRLAMQAYMATIASEKVGFTLVTNQADGQKNLVDGMRGASERNIMRYYLAVDSYLASLAEPPATRLESRLQHWFDATERYPRQLHEIDRTAYLSMKRIEHERQSAVR